MPIQYKTLLLMPYFHSRQIFTLSGFTFIPKSDLSSYLNDQPLYDHICSILNMYKSSAGNIINHPTIVTYSGRMFRNPSTATLNKLREIRSALTFAAFLKNNSWSFNTSDNFELVIQRFNVGDDKLALQGGSIHGITVGGLHISRSVFTTPPHINVSNFSTTFENEILFGILNCIKNQRNDPDSFAVLKSLNSFTFAYRNSHDMDTTSRILSMITAFELLFCASGRRQFRDSILRYSEELRPTYYQYNEINTTNGSIIRPLNLTGIQVWAEEFYKLRHRIIHSDITLGNDYSFRDLNNVFIRHNHHFAIALEVYAVCLTNKLREMNKINEYHIEITEKKNNHTIGKNLMNINNKEFTIIDRHLYDILSRI